MEFVVTFLIYPANVEKIIKKCLRFIKIVVPSAIIRACLLPFPRRSGWPTQDSLSKLARDLSSQPRLAVDTESNSLHAYREQVCLIQFSTANTDYLVDPLALPDLSAIAPLFSNPGIEKVFHAVEYDQICLKRDFGITFVNIFDTMQAARILGYKQVGLDAMLAEKLDLILDKRYQKADWGERPLSPEMLNYARLDTHHLLDLRDSLQAELQQRGRWELACEEFTRLAAGTGNTKADLPAWQRVKGTQRLESTAIGYFAGTLRLARCTGRISEPARL